MFVDVKTITENLYAYIRGCGKRYIMKIRTIKEQACAIINSLRLLRVDHNESTKITKQKERSTYIITTGVEYD